MNRRDALKTFAAVATGGSLPVVAPSLLPAVETTALPVVYFLERRAGVWQSILIGAEHIGFIGPEMTRNRVMEWASDYGFNPVFIDQTAECKP